MQEKPLHTDDWLNLALEELKGHGAGALKALPLSKKLNVTRGSFYHHFESLEVFHSAVIAHWSKRSSGPVIATAQTTPDPREALEHLLQVTFQSGEALERAVRSWATQHPKVAIEVEKVDANRINVTEELLIKCGLPSDLATTRARLLYWAAIGRLMMPFPEQSLFTKAQIVQITHLMLKP
ncbi:AcrR family transcriptional regulator [Rubricella aquisinus]|uniref:AcrR family transcriptional regulator n=1 Tax=Rubricella aquisinus TaxID=2028108 RepID=A0A840WN84_9RHOB|nr:TetR/AcrR family transcriptional regulator [Rubricella aquisinus]MBB5516061.1 AcrR family transcriptional regulator [Rubricella aquisinus]